MGSVDEDGPRWYHLGEFPHQLDMYLRCQISYASAGRMTAVEEIKTIGQENTDG